MGNHTDDTLNCTVESDSLFYLIPEKQYDTLVTGCDTSMVDIYYTTDGTNPLSSPTRQRYFNELSFSDPVILKAVAVHEDDSLWLPGDINTFILDSDATAVNPSFFAKDHMKSDEELSVYSINGRLLGRGTRAELLRRGKLNSGVLIISAGSNRVDRILKLEGN
ncbi:MAG: chitobiase/beta-hexosaminidase C-terminal domain-containing protein [Fibrobacterota bacterium]